MGLAGHGRYGGREVGDVRANSEHDQLYATEFDDLAMRLRFDFVNEIVEATITRPDGTMQRTSPIGVVRTSVKRSASVLGRRNAALVMDPLGNIP